jgi:LPXTG-site transpeptidase (sortase) family protein
MTKSKHNRSKRFKLGLIISAILFFAIMTIVQVGTAYWTKKSAAKHAKQVAHKPSIFSQNLTPIYSEPKGIYFELSPEKKVSLVIEEVGVDQDGSLSVPQNWQNAGWYKKGAKPGEKGNVIIDGHYDTTTGAPAAFWELKNLQEGAKVVVQDKLGKSYEYRVTSKFYIGINDSERTKIFEQTETKELTLITCGGVWDFVNATYNKRLVVKAHI